MKEKYDKLVDDYKTTSTKLKVFQESQGHLTPRPDWGEFDDKIEGCKLSSDDTHSKMRQFVQYASKLEKDYKENLAQLDEARKFIGLAGREARQNEINEQMGGKPADKKWFLGLGTGPEVPKYLRFSGKIRNKNLSKHDCELMVKEYWQEKVKYEKDKKKRESVSFFFVRFCKSFFLTRSFFFLCSRQTSFTFSCTRSTASRV